MPSRSPDRRHLISTGAATLVLLFGIACEREARPVRVMPARSMPADSQQMSSLRPGPSASRPAARENPYADNAWGIAQGKRLYSWFNCVGCHAHGGGGMGPPLKDAEWIYGGEAEDIFATIVEGRPNGMPSFGGMIPEDQVWQLVAYVQALSGRVRQDAAPSRADSMHLKKRELAVPDHPVSSERAPHP